MLEIRIIRIKIIVPTPIIDPAAVEAGRRIEHFLVILGLLHQELIILFVSEYLRHLGCRIVIIRVFKDFLHSSLEFIEEGKIEKKS